MISDYIYFDVNQQTLKIAPKEAMQFGCTLWWLLFCIHNANDLIGPVYILKVNLSDGFYRLWLHPKDTHQLAVLFPSRPNKPDLIGIPLANPMGWVLSPPNISACTETIADLQDPVAIQHTQATPHRLDVVSESDPKSTSSSTDTNSKPSIASTAIVLNATCAFWKPLCYWDICVDNFCSLSQGNKWQRCMVKQILFQALDKIFCPLDNNDTPVLTRTSLSQDI